MWINHRIEITRKKEIPVAERRGNGKVPEPLYLAGEHRVEQAEDRRNGQQNDERPNHASDHPLENINPRGLSFNLGLELGDLGSKWRQRRSPRLGRWGPCLVWGNMGE